MHKKTVIVAIMFCLVGLVSVGCTNSEEGGDKTTITAARAGGETTGVGNENSDLEAATNQDFCDTFLAGGANQPLDSNMDVVVQATDKLKAEAPSEIKDAVDYWADAIKTTTEEGAGGIKNMSPEEVQTFVEASQTINDWTYKHCFNQDS